jgi:hypothetical protein
MAEGDGYPKCFGPYLRYAISTHFESFEFFDERKNFRLFFLVEFKQTDPASTSTQDDPASNFQDAMKNVGVSVEFGPAEDKTPYATMRTSTLAVLEPHIVEKYYIWDKYVSRVELSLPVKPSPPPAEFFEEPIHRFEQGMDQPGSLLIGMMDDGCPFAAAHFLKTSANAAPSTRVRGIWDQNRGKQPINVNDSQQNPCHFGQTLPDFNYGLEFRRDFAASFEIDDGGLRLMGLDEWMGLHLTPAGSIDEDGCYADAEFTRLASQQSHGAHVMDVLVGLTPISSRIGPSYPGGDRRDPPSWKPGDPNTDPACGADLVFVQFSEDCIRDATGVWLKAYVLDGIRYILSFADPANTRKVIINLSYGPTTGPHDGTAELEAALTALVTYYDGIHNKPQLDVVLAAGNSYLTSEHVVFTGNNQNADVEWTWRLPPDNTVLCFAEVWMDDAAAAGSVSVTLTSPSGDVWLTSASGVTGVTLPTPGGTTPQVIGPIVWGYDRMWLLEVGPTVAAPGIMANEHGDWTIKVSHVGAGAQVDAYVARTDPNMGVTTGAKRSFFVDPIWERTRSAAASCTRVNGEFDNTGSLVSRFGTLNGIATAKDDSVHVAGGYVLLDGRKSPYSSAGPSRRYPTTPRVGPDFVLPCDESYALGGIRAGGNRSGAVFRLIGTSAAAPQLARELAKPAFPPATNVPSPGDVVEIEKRGGGNLEPP